MIHIRYRRNQRADGVVALGEKHIRVIPKILFHCTPSGETGAEYSIRDGLDE